MDKDSQNMMQPNSSRSIRLTAGRQLLIREFKRNWDMGKDAWIAELHRYLQQQDKAITLESTRRWVNTHEWITKPLEECSKDGDKASGSSTKLNETKNEPTAKAKLPSSSSIPKLKRAAVGGSKQSLVEPTATPTTTKTSVEVKTRSRMSLPSAKKTPGLTFSSLKRMSTVVESSASHKTVADSLTSPPELVYEHGGSSSSEEKEEVKPSDDPEKKNEDEIIQDSEEKNANKSAGDAEEKKANKSAEDSEEKKANISAGDSEEKKEKKDSENSEDSSDNESEDEKNEKTQPVQDKTAKDISENVHGQIEFDRSMIEVRRWVLTGKSPCSD